jgi:hypothetical protein
VIQIALIPRRAINVSADDDATFIVGRDEPFWAVIFDYAIGDIAWKVDLDGRAPRDYEAIARAVAHHLKTDVVWPDESTLSATAATRCTPDGSTKAVTLVDIEDDLNFLVGFFVRQHGG